MKRVLILAGTAEGRALCARLAGLPGIETTASLAGVTRRPAAYPVPAVSGGFGGAAGLARWLAAHRTDALVDATHPFAATMHENAAEAARTAGVPCLALARAGWSAGPGDRWRRHADLDALLDALPADARVLAALGPRAAAGLGRRGDVAFLLRAIEPPAETPANVRVLRARPPFAEVDERALLRAEGITHLAVRDAGGGPSAAKLVAARALGLPVLMLARPARPGGVPSVETVAEATTWVARTLAPSPIRAVSVGHGP